MPRSLCALCVALALPAWAGDFAPGGNSGTLARTSALPALGNPALLARGHTEAGATLDVTNEYVTEGSCAVECITLDGETTRLRLWHRRGLGGGWDFAMELPLLDRGGGFLDGWIQDWHGWFGLPNGGREQAADDQYRFHYERGGVVLLDQTSGGSGLGDATLTLGRALGRGRMVRAMAKLPTGDDRELGGGNSGGALWVEQALALPPGWSGYVALGASASERGAVLPQMQQREVAFGGIGLIAPLGRSVRLTGQLQVHSRLYGDSELSPLARIGAPLTLGLQFRTSRRGWLELGFQEDPSVNGSPDFVAYVSMRSL
jgi:hypothetical protein